MRHIEKLMILLLSVISLNVYAGYDWLAGVKVESVSMHWDGTNNILQAVLVSPISIGCTANDTTQTISYWIAGDFTLQTEVRANLLMAAAAQDVFVDIQYDNSSCSTSLGRKMVGVRLHKPS